MAEPTPFSRMLFGLLERAELIAVAAVLGGLGAHLAGFTGVDSIMVVAFGALAGIYFLMAYRPSEAPQPATDQKSGFVDLFSQTILPKLLWISCAVGASGLSMLHTRPDNDGYLKILQIHALLSVLVVVVVGLLLIQGKSKNLIPVLYRTIPLALASAYLIAK